jgi:molybdopterin/thiamine biosynthesis adenylyltransferase/rhodanese-related sulfurtransferase
MRYIRQLPVIGVQGQQRLQQAKVLCVGTGGLGSPALLYLTSCGVGTIGVVDDDRVELSNLQRQVLFRESDIGLAKSTVACERLRQLNSTIVLREYATRLTLDNAEAIIADYHIVLDCTDNFASRYLLNHLCRQQAIPLVSASILQFNAHVTVFNYRQGPCLECLYPTPPAAGAAPSCDAAGVLGVVPGIAGSLQALEAIKIILEHGDILTGQLLCIDGLTMTFSRFNFNKSVTCQPSVCSPNKPLESIMNVNESVPQIEPAEFARNRDRYFLLDVREAHEKEICDIGGDLIPVNTLVDRLAELPKDKPIVVYCRSGGRSARATELLLDRGFDALNLTGGILRWIDDVDDSLQKY